MSTVKEPFARGKLTGQNTGMLDEVLQRIEKRLEAVGLKAAVASRKAGLSEDAIRNLRRGSKTETGRHGASTRTIEKLAVVLETTPGWLLDGIGDEDASSTRHTVPIMGYVGAAARVEPEYEQVPTEGLDTIELPFAVPSFMIAFVIVGDSMLPVYNDGDAVIVYRDQMRGIESFYGEEAVVLTSEGKRYLKTILKGGDGFITLNSFNARPMEDVDVTWVGEIYVTIRASQLRRMNAQVRASRAAPIRSYEQAQVEGA